MAKKVVEAGPALELNSRRPGAHSYTQPPIQRRSRRFGESSGLPLDGAQDDRDLAHYFFKIVN